MTGDGVVWGLKSKATGGDAIDMSDAAAVFRRVNELEERTHRAERNARAMFDNLTAVQAKCTELLERARRAENRITGKACEEVFADAGTSKYLQALQTDHKTWTDRNFPNADPVDAVLGVAEEVGELCHAILKQRQGIRGTSEEHEAKAKDAVGDIVIYLLDVCTRRGWSFGEIVAETWAEVRKRDWTKKEGAT
jgi:NTP pyrophosphatase (non-canonical NTP hydrolase)